MLLTIGAVYGLARLGVIEMIGGQVGLPELLRFLICASLIMGFLLAFLTGRITLMPLRRIIEKLDRLANGDFNARLHFGKPIGEHPAFRQLEQSFNQAAEEPEHMEILRNDFINNFRMSLRRRSFPSQVLQSFCAAERTFRRIVSPIFSTNFIKRMRRICRKGTASDLPLLKKYANCTEVRYLQKAKTE